MKFWANYIGLSSWNIIRVSSHLVILHLIRGIRWCAGILDLIRSHRGGRPPPISPHFRHWPSVTATFSPTVCQLYFSQFIKCISFTLESHFLYLPTWTVFSTDRLSGDWGVFLSPPKNVKKVEMGINEPMLEMYTGDFCFWPHKSKRCRQMLIVF